VGNDLANQRRQSKAKLKFNSEDISTSERITRLCVAYAEMLIVAIVLAYAASWIHKYVGFAVFLCSVAILVPALFSSIGELSYRSGAKNLLASARHWSPATLPPEFRFIQVGTTVKDVVDVLGKYSRIRGCDQIQALQYNLDNGSAVIIFPEWPFSYESRVIGVLQCDSKNKVPLFP
jgi:hypothetical protein